MFAQFGTVSRTRPFLVGLALVVMAGLGAALQPRPADADIVHPPPWFKPNLVVSTEFISPNGFNAHMIVRVTNTSLVASAGAFAVLVTGKKIGSSGPIVTQTYAISGLAPGQTKGILHMLPPFSCGAAHQRTVIADHGNVVVESNEGDNQTTVTYHYPVC
jgi:hypothetical protein